MFSAALRVWEAEHVGTADLDDTGGRLTVQRTDSIIRVNLDWLRSQGHGHVIHHDGRTLRFDDEREYRWVRDLSGPFTAYEHV